MQEKMSSSFGGKYPGEDQESITFEQKINGESHQIGLKEFALPSYFCV